MIYFLGLSEVILPKRAKWEEEKGYTAYYVYTQYNVARLLSSSHAKSVMASI